MRALCANENLHQGRLKTMFGTQAPKPPNPFMREIPCTGEPLIEGSPFYWEIPYWGKSFTKGNPSWREGTPLRNGTLYKRKILTKGNPLKRETPYRRKSPCIVKPFVLWNHDSWKEILHEGQCLHKNTLYIRKPLMYGNPLYIKTFLIHETLVTGNPLWRETPDIEGNPL